MEDLLALVRRLGAGPVRDIGMLDAAAVRPRSNAFGEDAYPTLAAKAAPLLHSIVRGHALLDGNERLGWLATVVLLDLNDHEPRVTDDEAFTLVMDVATGVADVPGIAVRLHVAPTAGRPATD